MSEQARRKIGALVRAMAGRLLRLSYVLMGALGDDAETTESLARIISLDGGQG